MSGAAQLQGRRILVIGATGGLGAAIARSLHAHGADLTVSGRNAARLSVIAQDLGAMALRCDLSSSAERVQLANMVGELDGLVFAAGLAPVAPVRYLKDADLTACMDVNAAAPLLLARDLLKHKRLRSGASLVWISSVASRRGTAGYAGYAASKAALQAAARCLALELAPKEMRVNCIAPGMIETEMADAAAERMSGEVLAAHLKAYPLGLGRPADVASAVSFLLSSESRWITGVTLPVDGGFSI